MITTQVIQEYKVAGLHLNFNHSPPKLEIRHSCQSGMCLMIRFMLELLSAILPRVQLVMFTTEVKRISKLSTVVGNQHRPILTKSSLVASYKTKESNMLK